MMKKTITCLLLLLAMSVYSFAQTTISYGQISSYCPQTGDMLGGGGAVAITFYDGYIYHPMYGNLTAVQRNSDGSTTYVPSGPAGTLAVQLNAVLVSANRQKMEERITSTMGYMSLNMINSYTSMGEDGGRAAKSWMDAQGASRRGGGRHPPQQRRHVQVVRGNGSLQDSKLRRFKDIMGGLLQHAREQVPVLRRIHRALS